MGSWTWKVTKMNQIRVEYVNICFRFNTQMGINPSFCGKDHLMILEAWLMTTNKYNSDEFNISTYLSPVSCLNNALTLIMCA